MSGAVEGVALQERVDTLEAALVTVRVNLMRDPTKTEAVCEFARSVLRGDTLLEAVVAAEAVTTPPARSYADGVEDAAKVCDERAAGRIRLYEENQALINAFKASEAEDIAAAIRLLSQGGKA